MADHNQFVVSAPAEPGADFDPAAEFVIPDSQPMEAEEGERQLDALLEPAQVAGAQLLPGATGQPEHGAQGEPLPQQQHEQQQQQQQRKRHASGPPDAAANERNRGTASYSDPYIRTVFQPVETAANRAVAKAAANVLVARTKAAALTSRLSSLQQFKEKGEIPRTLRLPRVELQVEGPRAEFAKAAVSAALKKTEQYIFDQVLIAMEAAEVAAQYEAAKAAASA